MGGPPRRAASLPAAKKPVQFPLYMMKAGETWKFLPMQEAGVLLDSGWQPVEVGTLVLNEDFTLREMTEADRRTMQQIADAHSASK